MLRAGDGVAGTASISHLNPSGLLPRPKVTKSKVNLNYLVSVHQAQPFFMGSVFPAPHPHIEHPTDADVEKYHALYVSKLVELFDRYKKFNPDYADKQLAVE